MPKIMEANLPKSVLAQNLLKLLAYKIRLQQRPHSINAYKIIIGVVVGTAAKSHLILWICKNQAKWNLNDKAELM